MSPFSSKCFPHKLVDPGVRYVMGVSIHYGKSILGLRAIYMWVLEWFKEIWNNRLYHLRTGWDMFADEGYKHRRSVTPNNVDLLKLWLMHGKIRAIHETCSERLKCSAILRQLFLHSIQLQCRVFHAVSKIVHLSILHEKPLFALQ